MMQGDAYGIPITIKTNNDTVLSDEDVIDVEVVIGKLRKSFAEGDISYDPDTQRFIFPLSQEESFGSAFYGGGGGGNKTITKKLKNGENYAVTIGTGGAVGANFFNAGTAGTNTVGFGETCTGGGGGGNLFGGAAGKGGTPNGENATDATGGAPNGGNSNAAGGNGYIEITID